MTNHPTNNGTATLSKPKTKSNIISSKMNDYRKNTKPLMEKRRRERINRSLEELKNIILDQTSQNSVRSHKLEKADILEMTVKHLRNLQKSQQMQQQQPQAHQAQPQVNMNDPAVYMKYKLGYTECAQECIRFMNSNNPAVNTMDPILRQRMYATLMRQIQSMNQGMIANQMTPNAQNYQQAQSMPQKQVAIKNESFEHNQSDYNSYDANTSSSEGSNDQNMLYRRLSVSPISATSSSSSSAASSSSATSPASFNLLSSNSGSGSVKPSEEDADSSVWRPW